MVKPTVSVVLLLLAGQARGAALEKWECAAEDRPIQVKVGVEPAPICVGSGATAVLEFESAIVEGRTVMEGGDVTPYTGKDGLSVALVASPGRQSGLRGTSPSTSPMGSSPRAPPFLWWSWRRAGCAR